LGLFPDKLTGTFEEIKSVSNSIHLDRRSALCKTMDYPTPEDNGWQLTDDGPVPSWLSCSHFPPSLCRKPPRKTPDVCSEEADDESPDRERKKQLEPPKKNHKKATSSIETD